MATTPNLTPEAHTVRPVIDVALVPTGDDAALERVLDASVELAMAAFDTTNPQRIAQIVRRLQIAERYLARAYDLAAARERALDAQESV